jgi:ABC-type bacteriocin/lantibiotic exporter with double-glycine peptidase domain
MHNLRRWSERVGRAVEEEHLHRPHERFYDPFVGKVMISGKDIRRLNLKSLHLRVGLVQQEPVLFATNIFPFFLVCP